MHHRIVSGTALALCACLLILPFASKAKTPEDCATFNEAIRVAMEFRLEDMAQGDAITLLEHRSKTDQVIWEWIVRVVYGMRHEDIEGEARQDYLRDVFDICLQASEYRLRELLEGMAEASGTTSRLYDPLAYDPP